MKEVKPAKETTYLISDSFSNTKQEGTHEVAFRRWLIREMDAGRITLGEAIEKFNLKESSAETNIRKWRKKYGSEIALTLPVMTEKEKQKVKALQERALKLEKQLEDAQMKNAALETMIDVAEEQLKIAIRKKSGPKQ